MTALHALGVRDVTVLTLRDTMAVASPIPSVVIEQLERTEDGSGRTVVVTARRVGARRRSSWPSTTSS